VSAAGQIDPVQALAQQQVINPQQAPQGQIDPVQALASGQVVTQNYGAPQSAMDQAAQNWKGPAWENPGGIPAAIVNAMGNGASFNLGDPISAAMAATVPSFYKGGSQAPDWSQRYSDNVKKARETTAYSQQQHPYVSTAAGVAGGVMNPANLIGGAPASLASSVGRGAVMGGLYGLGADVGTGKSAQDMATDAGLGATTGGVLGAATHGLGSMLKGATRGPDEQLLADEGVPLTMGQSLGGTAKSIEDGSTHIPVVGGAIEARQADSLEGFNRAAYNRVLDPLGLKYDPTGPVGHNGIAALQDPIDEAYDAAWKGATIAKSPEVLNGIDSATEEASHVLEPSKVTQIQANINRLITSKFDENGELDASALKTAKNFFAEQSRAAGPNASQADQATAKAYGNVLDSLKEGIRQVDPSRGDLLDAADTAYMRFVRVRDATSPNAASARGGIFTPSQLGAAIRGNDNSIGRINFATGTAPMQDLAVAGQRVLPSTVPNSGTPLRGLIQAAPWIGMTAMKDPIIAAGLGSGLGGGAALYSNPGQSLAKALLYGAPAARAAISKVPQALLPGELAAVLRSTPAKPGKDQQGTSQ
jgi:hypothetical protein